MANQFTYDNSLPINKLSHNLAEPQKDYAVFLPSISSIYAIYASKTKYELRNKLPDCMVNGMKDLDFLDPNNPFFYYPAALYSAGHANINMTVARESESMIHKRDRNNTVIIGDSGGFQAATGVLKYPWTPKPGQSSTDHLHDQDAVKMKLLRWLEETSDYSMVLDWPTFSLIKYGFDPMTGHSLHPGLKNFNDCLQGTLENHKFFIKHRKEGATKWLNVLQGRNKEEGDIWWDAVKDLPFEAWAFSNAQASNMVINLKRLITMRDNNYLAGREWLHYLGIGKVRASCVFTTLQRTLRKRVDPNLTVSYDASSPFVQVAKGMIYYDYLLDHERMKFRGGAMPDDKNLKGSTRLLSEWIAEQSNFTPGITTSISNNITLGELCTKGYEDLQYKKIPWSKKEIDAGLWSNSSEGKAGDMFKWSRAYKEYLTHSSDFGGLFDFGTQDFSKDYNKYEVKWPSSLDAFGYILAMNHNVEVHVAAMQAASYWLDQPTNKALHHISSDLIEFNDLCDEIFTTERPMQLIDRYEGMLKVITGQEVDYNISVDLENFG